MIIPFGRPEAIARVSGNELAPNLFGSVKFYRMGKGVLVVADISGLPQSDTGIFALHIHEGGSCTGVQFADTGGHYDPAGVPHPRHAGDLPPLFSCGGHAFLAVLTDRFQIQNIIGRTLVIHTDPDDFHTQPAGAAGKKMACGVITSI